jgi:phospholipid transport system substrate-binding protein
MSWKHFSKQDLAGLFMAWAILLGSGTATASPQDTVIETLQEVLEILQERQIEVADDPAYFYRLADEIVAPHFDFRRMSQRVLGRYWREATEEQRSAFAAEFRQLLVRTYVNALRNYTTKDMREFIEERIKVLPTRYSPDATRANVRVLVEPERGGPPINLTLSLYRRGEETWKVDDVQVEGASLVTTHRATFSREIRTLGIDGLIETLAERNRQALLQ